MLIFFSSENVLSRPDMSLFRRSILGRKCVRAYPAEMLDACVCTCDPSQPVASPGLCGAHDPSPCVSPAGRERATPARRWDPRRRHSPRSAATDFVRKAGGRRNEITECVCRV